MIRVSRRGVIAGALAVPTVAGLAHWRWRHGERSLLLHDPALSAGRRFAAAGSASGAEVLVIEGDRVRLALAAVGRGPALIAGISRHADALMIEDVAGESGYVPAAVFHAQGDSCALRDCRPGWTALGRMANAAGGAWVEALASYAARPGQEIGRFATALPARADAGLVIGWVLTPKA